MARPGQRRGRLVSGVECLGGQVCAHRCADPAYLAASAQSVIPHSREGPFLNPAIGSGYQPEGLPDRTSAEPPTWTAYCWSLAALKRALSAAAGPVTPADRAGLDSH